MLEVIHIAGPGVDLRTNQQTAGGIVISNGRRSIHVPLHETGIAELISLWAETPSGSETFSKSLGVSPPPVTAPTKPRPSDLPFNPTVAPPPPIPPQVPSRPAQPPPSKGPSKVNGYEDPASGVASA